MPPRHMYRTQAVARTWLVVPTSWPASLPPLDAMMLATLAMDPELMLLDEPTQGMGHEDVDRVTQLIKKVGANRTILMVEHNMSVVSKIADTISVLQRGQVIAEGPYEVVSKNPQVLEAYMGTADNQLEGAHG